MGGGKRRWKEEGNLCAYGLKEALVGEVKNCWAGIKWVSCNLN